MSCKYVQRAQVVQPLVIRQQYCHWVGCYLQWMMTADLPLGSGYGAVVKKEC